MPIELEFSKCGPHDHSTTWELIRHIKSGVGRGSDLTGPLADSDSLIIVIENLFLILMLHH